MALLNNVYYNAAIIGFVQGALSGRKISSGTAGDYTALKNAAVAFATKLDSLIAFDALVTTGASNTMLVDTASNTIQANTQQRTRCLQGIVAGVMAGSYTEDATAADYTTLATAVAAAFTTVVAALVCP